MPRFRRPAPEPDVIDLDDALASYEVTRAVAAEPILTGLPEPSARRAAAAASAAAQHEADDAPEVVPPVVDALPAPQPVSTEVRLHLGEALDLEVIDLDGTGYLFRAVVIGDGEVPQVAISGRTADDLQGWEVLTSGAQVVAVVQRDDESWLLTSRIVGTSWVEAAAVVDLQPLQRALSTGRRVHQRVQRQVRVALPADVPCTRAQTVDLSTGGAAIEVWGAGDPPSGSFELVLMLRETVELRAVVNGNRAGSSPDSRVWHAQFVVVPALARQRLIDATA